MAIAGVANSRVKMGLLCALGYCVVSAFSRIVAGDVEQAIHPITLCFYVFGMGVCLFALINVKQLKPLTAKIIAYRQDAFWLNIATLGAWVFLIYPLKYIEPSIVNAITLGIGPMVTLTFGFFIYKNGKIARRDYLLSILLFVVIAYIIYVVFHQQISNPAVPAGVKLWAVLSCLVVGVSVAMNVIFSKRLQNVGFSPMDILITRFLLVLVVTGVWQLLINHPGFTMQLWLDLFGVSIAMVVVPLYLFQIAIRELEPIAVALIVPIMPIITYLFEFGDGRLHPTWVIIPGLISVTLLSLTSGYLKYRSSKRLPEVVAVARAD